MDKKRLYEKLKNFPKVDLHRHLEGSITAETLLEISKKFGGKLPSDDIKRLRTLIQMTHERPSFQTFLDKFKIFRGFYTCREAVQEVAFRAVQQAAEDSVKYMELRYSPTHFASMGRFPETEVVQWIKEAIDRACRQFDIIVLPIITISRDYGLEIAKNTVQMALNLPSGYFYGIDLAGDEAHHPALPFAKLFEAAKMAGWGLTIHAGETGNPSNIKQAVKRFKADRIGHGIAAASNPEVLNIVQREQTLLEVCLTSNLQTGAVSSIKKHPVKNLIRQGVAVNLNTDDPAICGISLTHEYVLAVADLGFTGENLKNINLQALEHSFYPDRTRLKKLLGHYWC